MTLDDLLARYEGERALAMYLRRWDDEAKVAGRPTREVAHYRPLLEGLLVP